MRSTHREPVWRRTIPQDSRLGVRRTGDGIHPCTVHRKGGDEFSIGFDIRGKREPDSTSNLSGIEYLFSWKPRAGSELRRGTKPGGSRGRSRAGPGSHSRKGGGNRVIVSRTVGCRTFASRPVPVVSLGAGPLRSRSPARSGRVSAGRPSRTGGRIGWGGAGLGRRPRRSALGSRSQGSRRPPGSLPSPRPRHREGKDYVRDRGRVQSDRRDRADARGPGPGGNGEVRRRGAVLQPRG